MRGGEKTCHYIYLFGYYLAMKIHSLCQHSPRKYARKKKKKNPKYSKAKKKNDVKQFLIFSLFQSGTEKDSFISLLIVPVLLFIRSKLLPVDLYLPASHRRVSGFVDPLVPPDFPPLIRWYDHPYCAFDKSLNSSKLSLSTLVSKHRSDILLTYSIS